MPCNGWQLRESGGPFPEDELDSLDLTLNWTVVSGATGYRIYESLEPDLPGSEVATVAGPPYVVRTSAQNLKRFYYITALQ